MTPATLMVVLLLAGLLIAGSRVGLGHRRLPGPLQAAWETGVPFVLLGLLAGPQVGNLLTRETLENLRPVFLIGLGWIGFLYGSHFEWRRLRRFPLNSYAMGAFESIFTLALVALGFWWALGWGWLGPLTGRERTIAALLFGICASGTSPTGLFQRGPGKHLDQANLTLLRFLAAVDSLPALLVLGLMGGWFHPARQSLAGLAGWAPWWMAMGAALGILLGWITHWLFPGREQSRHNELVLLAVVSLGSGAAAAMGYSPLFVTALAGMVFANISPRKESAYGVLAGREHALYAGVLLVAGMVIHFEIEGLGLLLGGYLVLRFLGKLAGGLGGWLLFNPHQRISPALGTGLIFQGGMTLALALSFESTHQAPWMGAALLAVVLGVLCNGLLAPPLTGFLLRRDFAGWKRGT